MNTVEFFSKWQNLLFIAFCIIVAIQIFYYLFFFSRLAFYNPKGKQVSQTHPVSVIVCSRDEAENLVKNLPGVLIQQYGTTHEVIVVNDNSLDESKYILEAYQKTYKQLQIVELKQEARFISGKKFPLSIGIKTAKHEIVLLTDADCVPASEFWIEKMQEAFNDDVEIVLGYGAFHKKKGFFNKLVRWEALSTALQYLSYALAGLPYMGVGRNLSYKKSVFFRQKGFSSHNLLPGGDDDLFINKAANEKNTAIVIDHDAFTLSDAPRSWKKWIRQKSRHYTTSKYYKSIHKFLLGLYTFSLFLFYPLFVVSLITYSWKEALIVFGIRFLIQGVVLFKVTRKLNEKDLFPFFLVLDIWMFFYFILFSSALYKKPKPTWN
jgi:cellulose synthase/poly-beta-1,6-N-acetylglucosamine synthase-like glycosyltransferase